jgi:PAS domain-containing protein
MSTSHDPPVRGAHAKLGGAPLRAPSLDELETLVTCAAEGSFASAATSLSISRPAVAKRIANLEALAGRELLRRAGSGVTLTHAGAQLVAATPPIFHQREILLEVLAEIRNESERSARLRELLGHTSTAMRAAQKPEARLTTAERLLEFIVSACSTGVVFCDADTTCIEEANTVFCAFVGRERPRILGSRLVDAGLSFAGESHPSLIKRLAQEGSLEQLGVSVERPDGSVAYGTASARLIRAAGTALVAIVVDESPVSPGAAT